MVIERVVQQHYDEASFLWLLHGKMARSAKCGLWQLAELDKRLEAHLEGLVVAGKEIWPLLCPHLELPAPGELFPLAYLALKLARKDYSEQCEQAVVRTPSLKADMEGAMRWLIGIPGRKADTAAPNGESWSDCARRMPRDQCLNWFDQVKRNPEKLQMAVRISYGIADARTVPWLIEHMADPMLGPFAGEAFSLITGVDLNASGLTRESDGESVQDIGQPGHEDLTYDLPLPDQSAVAKWWEDHRESFLPGVRYILGKPVNPVSALAALKFGSQPQRATAAKELAWVDATWSDFDVTSSGCSQLKRLKLRRKDFGI